MNTNDQSKEKRILVVMRKILANIVKDTTPRPGLHHPLKEQTIQDIRECFKLISAREQELAEEAGLTVEDRPRFADEPQKTKVVSFKTVKNNRSGESMD